MAKTLERDQIELKTQRRDQAELSKPVQPIDGKLGATIMGPANPSREAENRDTIVPPRVDHGTVANMRWSFADSHMHLSEGGWGRQTTARELPIATELAGVNMRLTPCGVRELHWHKQAEWAYMLKGFARITPIDQDGRTFQDNVGEGDLWYFPQAFRIPFRGSSPMAASFCLSLTTATSPKKQVLMNLILNGIEAMKDANGELTITFEEDRGRSTTRFGE
jgi:oxalate decarboxylase family bicupin protein